MSKSELHRLWDAHVTASIAFQTQKAAGERLDRLDRLKESVAQTRSAYEKLLRTGKVSR